MILLLLQGIHLVAQEFEINNFGPNNYRAASDNYDGLEDSKGVWYFANENGVLTYNGSTWRLTTIRDYSSVHALYHQDSGRIYVGGNNEFGYLTGEFKYVSLRGLIDTSTAISEIWNIIEVADNIYFECREKIIRYDGKRAYEIGIQDGYLFQIGNELFASIYNQGLALITKDGYELINEDFNFPNDGAFHAHAMLDHHQDSTTSYLLTTAFNGLYKFNPTSQKIEKWPTEIDELLKNAGIAEVIIWRDSLYAISTLTSGLVFLDENGYVQKALGEDNGLSRPDNQIKTLFDQINPKIEGLINEENGLPTNQLRSLFQDQRGNLWISSLYGISYLKWNDNYDTSFVPRVILKQISKDVPKSKRTLEFRFSTPGYDKSDLEYSFYLEGFEDAWLPWTAAVAKEYTNLDGGAYAFHVKSKTNKGLVSSEVSYSFVVPTPWYKNVWTYLFGFSILSISIFLGVRYRTTRLKMLNRKLEVIIDNRTRELIMQKEQLKTTNEDLRVINAELDNFVYRSSHDLIAPLKSLKGLVNLARHDDPGESQVTYLNMMNSSIVKLENFIKSIMEYSMNVKKEIEHTPIFLDNILEDIIGELKFFDNANKVTFVKAYPLDFAVTTDPYRLKIVLSNLITNSIKYHNYSQNDPYVRVEAFKESGFAEIDVIDNGKGIDPQYIDHIFSMFYRASDIAEGSGLGLYIVKDTLAKIKGSIRVESEIRKGSKFSIRLPDH
ncbi:HAMP domain-containing sensor histidine kinase [Fulvivirga sp. M361]|uniref:sensor histidine kinase n=1 Tax=Fulvivirga sp. M361 TaxID=2594266 RepID=UPI001627CDD7|nr:HAMP domain-containing sensor histidine kinase [Fulvivirga sp. M361]